MEKPLRQQLTEAMQECRRQIEFLTESQKAVAFTNPYGPRQNNRREIELMEIGYKRLTQALADLEDDHA